MSSSRSIKDIVEEQKNLEHEAYFILRKLLEIIYPGKEVALSDWVGVDGGPSAEGWTDKVRLSPGKGIEIHYNNPDEGSENWSNLDGYLDTINLIANIIEELEEPK